MNTTTADILPWERWSMGTWLLLCILSSLLGNSAILRYLDTRMGMEKVMVVILKNIAVADLCYTVLSSTPTAVSYFAGRHVTGPIMCHLEALFNDTLFLTNMLLVFVLGLNKLVIVLRPFYARTRSTVKTSVLVMAVCWGPSALLVVINACSEGTARFSGQTFICWHTLTNRNTQIIVHNIFKVILITCLIGIILSIFALLFVAQRQARFGLNRTGTVTTLAVALLYLALYGPTFLLVNFRSIGYYLQLTRLAIALASFNSSHNFLTYYLTIRSFKKFLHASMPSCIPRRGGGEARMTGPTRSTGGTLEDGAAPEVEED